MNFPLGVRAIQSIWETTCLRVEPAQTSIGLEMRILCGEISKPRWRFVDRPDSGKLSNPLSRKALPCVVVLEDYDTSALDLLL